MTNILFYLTRFPGWGGIETVTEIIGLQLNKQGYDITILTHTRQDRPSKLLDKVHYYVMPDEGQYNTVQNQEYLKEIIFRQNIDILLFQDSYADNHYIVDNIVKTRVGGGKNCSV